MQSICTAFNTGFRTVYLLVNTVTVLTLLSDYGNNADKTITLLITMLATIDTNMEIRHIYQIYVT